MISRNVLVKVCILRCRITRPEAVAVGPTPPENCGLIAAFGDTAVTAVQVGSAEVCYCLLFPDEMMTTAKKKKKKNSSSSSSSNNNNNNTAVSSFQVTLFSKGCADLVKVKITQDWENQVGRFFPRKIHKIQQ